MNCNKIFKKFFNDGREMFNIVFEGVDNCGKSARSEMLYRYLSKNLDKNVFNVNLYSHPSGKYCKEERELLLNNNISPVEEVEIFTKCKNKLIDAINKNNKDGKLNINIIDRWILSTIAYQNVMAGNDDSNFTDSQITKMILEDNAKNYLHIDAIIYNNIKKSTFNDRISNKDIDAKELWLSEHKNFESVTKIYDSINTNFLLAENTVILNKEKYNNAEQLVKSILQQIKWLQNKGRLKGND